VAIQDYTNYHFKTEEKLFKEKKYPKAAEHIKIHNEFVTEVNKLADEYKNNPNILSVKTMTLLQRWLTNHILIEDKKYIRYLM
jgi:hemerythrin-like metal-binding protein